MRKKTLIILVILIALVSIIGVSYASWLFTGRQKDFNTLRSKCFELTMMNESEGITLDKTYPISDEEGLSTTGYTFTIKNTCNIGSEYGKEDFIVIIFKFNKFKSGNSLENIVVKDHQKYQSLDYNTFASFTDEAIAELVNTDFLYDFRDID